MLISSTLAAQEEVAKVEYKLTLECMPSEELSHVISTIPAPDYQSKDFAEWKETTINELQTLITLIDSGKIGNAEVEFRCEAIVKEAPQDEKQEASQNKE